jgi:hypothetical protein
MARIKDQNKNGMHGKISTTVPNHPKSQIKDAVRNRLSPDTYKKGCIEGGGMVRRESMHNYMLRAYPCVSSDK